MSSSMILLAAIRNIYLINDPARQPQAPAPGLSDGALLAHLCTEELVWKVVISSFSVVGLGGAF